MQHYAKRKGAWHRGTWRFILEAERYRIDPRYTNAGRDERDVTSDPVEGGEYLSIAQMNAPIDMVLFCPNCGTQHIDAADHPHYGGSTDEHGFHPRWDNPPHRSHLCHKCNYVWRPADVPTNGVAAIRTRGKNDSRILRRAAPAAETP